MSISVKKLTNKNSVLHDALDYMTILERWLLVKLLCQTTIQLTFANFYLPLSFEYHKRWLSARFAMSNYENVGFFQTLTFRTKLVVVAGFNDSAQSTPEEYIGTYVPTLFTHHIYIQICEPALENFWNSQESTHKSIHVHNKETTMCLYCVCACIVCVYVYIAQIYVYVCTYICMLRECIYCVCVCIYICIYVYVICHPFQESTLVKKYSQKLACEYTCIFMYISLYMCIYTHIHIYMYVYIYLCLCMYIYIYIYTYT